jgi:CDP-6-deoxy-D-xylo-4-hexulose-3-dehydrase
VPVSGKVYDYSDMQNLVESGLDFWLTTGRFNREFEKTLARFLGTQHVLTCNSGSSANLLALTALTSHLLKDKALKAGDEVITCATGFPTTINPILINNLVPVFLDVDIPSYNMDISKLEEAITPKTKAIMVAHTLGNPFDLEKISEIAKKYNLFLIEDTCDALGAEYNGQKVGTFGDIGTLSFYPAHHITMGEGGAVFTNRSVLKRALESIRDWGRDCYCEPGKDNTCNKRFCQQLGDLPFGYDHKYTYSHVGYNLKITDMQASVGLAQLKHLPKFIEKRQENFDILFNGLKEFEEFFILPKVSPKAKPSWFGFPITLRPNVNFTRNKLVEFLDENKIGTRLLFGGNLLKQPYMKNQHYKIIGDLKNSDIVVNNTFWIGVYPGLGTEELNYVLEIFRKFIKAN